MKSSIFNRVSRAFLYLAFAKALLITTSCKSDNLQVAKVTASQTQIDSSLQEVEEIKSYIAPFKESLDAQMDEELSYNPVSMHKNDTPLNTAIGNMLVEIVRTQGEPIYKSRSGNMVDAVLLNHGGIRAAMPAGAVTMRRAYEIMPFDNEMVVVTLTEEKMSQLVNYLIEKKRAHPFDGFKISLNDGQTPEVKMTPQKTYHVLTSDYLYNGGDNMSFFKDAPMVKLDYKIRNAMIDYFKKVDTLNFKSDDRFIEGKF